MFNLELKIRPDYKKLEGIHVESTWASRKDIPLAEAMVQYVDEKAEEWATKYDRKAWALCHAQLTTSSTPKRIFVVHPSLVEDDAAAKNTKFPSRMIFNARIVELDTHFERQRKVQKTVWNPKTERRELGEGYQTYQVPNVIEMKEGCMSYPDRKPKNVQRIFKLKVRYWYPVTILGFTFLWRKTEEVEGLKAQIFQHEIQHFEGENIYYPKQKHVDVGEEHVFDTQVMA